MNQLEKKMVYANAPVYKISDADCERLVLGAMAKGINRVFVLPSSLPAVNRVGDGTLKVCVGVAYPSGAYEKEVKRNEIDDLVRSGEHFDELYAVLAVGRLISGYADECFEEMRLMVETAQGKPVYFIIEAGMMSEAQKKEVVELAIKAGAKGIVASTDFVPYDLTFPQSEDIKILADAAAGRIRIVACGGIDTREKAEDMLEAGAELVCARNAFDILSK